MNAQRPKPPWLFTAGTQSVRAVATLAALSFFFSPVTSTIRFKRFSSRARHPAGDEVREVVLFFAVEGVGDGKAQVVVLDVADHLVHVFQRLGELLLPGIGIGHDMVEIWHLSGSRRVDGPGGVEIHVAGRAHVS